MPERLIGRWWTPSAPEEKAFGTLVLSKDDGPRLQILSEIDEHPPESLPAIVNPLRWLASAKEPRPTEPVTVHGKTQNGRDFTLYDGFLGGADLYFNRGIEGACVNSPATLPLTGIYMRYPGLVPWLSVNPFESNFRQNQASVALRVPEKQSFRIDEDRKLVVTWSFRGPCAAIVQTSIGLQAHPWLGIEYASPVVQDEACEDAAAIEEFLSLLLGQVTVASRTIVHSPEHIENWKDKQYHTELTLLGCRFRPPRTFRKWTPHDVLLPLPEIGRAFETLLQNWFQMRREHRHVVVPYIAAQRSPSPLSEGRFFDLAAVAESLHSQFCANERAFPDEEKDAICEKVLDFIPEERSELFRNALQRVNALSYKQRLQRLLQRFPRLVQDAVGDQREQEVFCGLVTVLRNTEAHRLKYTKRTRVGGLGLVRITAKLRAIIDAWLLAEIGIPESQIEEAMRRNRRYWYYASKNSWPWSLEVASESSRV